MSHCTFLVYEGEPHPLLPKAPVTERAATPSTAPLMLHSDVPSAMPTSHLLRKCPNWKWGHH
jgi:hypothetical protein